MEKESVKKFDLEAAFKALDEIEIPQAKGIKANRVDLKERFSHKPATETLVEDYYDVSSNEDLEEAKEEREAEVAQAKLARIEKIVDLDAETPEDLQPSYVGKVIMQCPQCMTLFYKKPEDIEPSEENPDIVNLNEPCQHCGNTSGYTLIGKVGAVEEDEADKYEEVPAEESELDLDFEEPTEEVDAEGTGEGADEMSSDETTEDDLDLDLDLDLDEIPEEEPEEEKKKEESLELSNETSENESEHKSENLTLNEEIDKDLDKKLAEHNDYIEYLKNLINQDEEALKKAENEEIKAAIQRHLDTLNADLEAALPDALKSEAPAIEEPVEEVPAVEETEEAPVEEEEKPTEAQAEEEPKEEAPVEEEKVEEALTEETEECKVVLSDKPEKEVFAGSKEDCEKIIEKNKDTETAKEHGLEIIEPKVEESLNKSEEVSENETENKSENLTLNEGAEAEIDSIIASWGLNESLTEESNLDKLLDSEEFKTPVTDAEIEAARKEATEESLEECGEKLTEEPEDQEVMSIIDSWSDDEKKEEGYTGNPAERTTHLEYTDDNPADGKAVLPDNIEKQLTESECEEPLEECGEKSLKEEAPIEEPVEEEPKEELPNVDFNTEEVKEVAQEAAEEVIKEAEAEVEPEVVEEKVEEVVADAVEEKVEAEEEAPVEGEEITAEVEDKPVEEDINITNNDSPSRVDNRDQSGDTAEPTEEGLLSGVAGLANGLSKGLDDIPVVGQLLASDEAEKKDIKECAKTEEGLGLFGIGDVNVNLDASGQNNAVGVGGGEGKTEDLKPEDKKEEGLLPGLDNLPLPKLPGLGEDIEAEELDEASFNEHINKFLTEVYSNVKSFEATSCESKEGKLIVEGKISFNSGKERLTMFEFLPNYGEGQLFFEGYNKDFSTDKAFTLNCSINESKTIITESFGYKYKINETLVEGLK